MTDTLSLAKQALNNLTHHINSFESNDALEHKYNLTAQKLNRVMEENHKLRKQRDDIKMDNFKYEGFGGLKTQYNIMKDELARLKTASNIETADRLEKLIKINKQKKKKLEQFEKTITRLKKENCEKDKQIADERYAHTEAMYDLEKGKNKMINEKDIEIKGYKDELSLLECNSVGDYQDCLKAKEELQDQIDWDKEINKKKDIEIAGYKTMIENNAHELLESTNNEQRMRAIINKFLNQELYNKVIEEYYSDNEHNITDNIETTGADIHNQALAHNQELKDKKEKKEIKPSQQLKLELKEPNSPKQIITGEGKTKIRADTTLSITPPDDLIAWGQQETDTKNSIYANIRKKHKKQINKKKHLIEYKIVGIVKQQDFIYTYKLTIPITTP